MRYQVRWSNGYWKTFDLHQYADVSMHMTKVEAERAVAEANLSGRRPSKASN